MISAGRCVRFDATSAFGLEMSMKATEHLLSRGLLTSRTFERFVRIVEDAIDSVGMTDEPAKTLDWS
jgi:hypothetical protein